MGFGFNTKVNKMTKIGIGLVLSVLIAFSATAQKYRATITTQYGKVEMTLYDATPKHRDNFVKLAKKHFYDGTLFHRVIPEFMIQGGDPESKQAAADKALGNGDVGYRIPAEFNDKLYHKKGALAAARDGNPEKASSGCQFYIVVGKKFDSTALSNISNRTGVKYTEEQKQVYATTGGTPHLDNNYTVFGQVTKGMDIVEKIVAAKRNGMDRPNEDQKIIKLRVKKKTLFFWH